MSLWILLLRNRKSRSFSSSSESEVPNPLWCPLLSPHLILIALAAKCLATHAETYRQATPPRLRADASEQPTNEEGDARGGREGNYRFDASAAPHPSVTHSLWERTSATFAEPKVLFVVPYFAPKAQNCSNLPNLTPRPPTRRLPPPPPCSSIHPLDRRFVAKR